MQSEYQLIINQLIIKLEEARADANRLGLLKPSFDERLGGIIDSIIFNSIRQQAKAAQAKRKTGSAS